MPPKFSLKNIGLFKVLDTIGEAAYKLSLPEAQLKLYLVFNISLLELFFPKKGQNPDSYLIGNEYLELGDETEDRQEVESIKAYKIDY